MCEGGVGGMGVAGPRPDFYPHRRDMYIYIVFEKGLMICSAHLSLFMFDGLTYFLGNRA